MDELKLYNSFTDTEKIFSNDVKMKTNTGSIRIWRNCGQKKYINI